MTTISLDNLKDILLSSEKPSRYTGGEYGMPELTPSRCNFCLCFPDLYEVGMSNLGIKIVAESIQKRGYTADFCFAPASDFGRAIQKAGVPLFSLGLRAPLGEFDMLGFSLSYELSYTNVLYMLDLAGIPFTREERKGGHYPLICAGGLCTVNIEPMADFFDIVFIGDGESSDADVCDLFVQCGGATEEFYRRAAQIEGVYVPSLTTVKYDENGHIAAFEGITEVKRAIVPDLDSAVFPSHFAVPNTESVHDRAVIEVMRGCYRGCRFCQAGFIYRPVRPRSVETLTRQACDLVANTGYEEVSMNSLSTGDYPHLSQLIHKLKEELPPEITLALPSLRVDSFDGEFAQDSRRISLTFAPEAGSQRLRNVINKDITKEEIYKAAESAFDVGYSAVKLYFMLGLPTETDDDLREIRSLCDGIKHIYNSKKRAKALRLSVSVSTFIPKPFTPFQWEKQATEEEVAQKQQLLRDTLFVRGISLSWNNYFPSRLEAVLARGDRRLSAVIAAAYRNGCTFDGWDDKLSYEGWRNAFDQCHISMDEYTRERAEDEILPWDIVNVGITKSFYLSERHKAYEGAVTGSCLSSCKGCGLQKICDVAKGGKK